MNVTGLNAIVSGRTGFVRSDKAAVRCTFATSLAYYIVKLNYGTFGTYQPDNFVLIDGNHAIYHHQIQIWDRHYKQFYNWAHGKHFLKFNLEDRGIIPVTNYFNETTFIIHTTGNSEVNIELISTKWKLYDEERSSGLGFS